MGVKIYNYATLFAAVVSLSTFRCSVRLSGKQCIQLIKHLQENRFGKLHSCGPDIHHRPLVCCLCHGSRLYINSPHRCHCRTKGWAGYTFRLRFTRLCARTDAPQLLSPHSSNHLNLQDSDIFSWCQEVTNSFKNSIKNSFSWHYKHKKRSFDWLRLVLNVWLR